MNKKDFIHILKFIWTLERLKLATYEDRCLVTDWWINSKNSEECIIYANELLVTR